MHEETPDVPEAEPPDQEEELTEIDLVDPLKREEDMPGLDPVVATPPE
jgi:hypothetical protein